MTRNNKKNIAIIRRGTPATAEPRKPIVSKIGAGLFADFGKAADQRGLSLCGALKDAVRKYVVLYGAKATPQAPCEREGLADDSNHSSDTRAPAPAPAPSCL